MDRGPRRDGEWIAVPDGTESGSRSRARRSQDYANDGAGSNGGRGPRAKVRAGSQLAEPTRQFSRTVARSVHGHDGSTTGDRQGRFRYSMVDPIDTDPKRKERGTQVKILCQLLPRFGGRLRGGGDATPRAARATGARPRSGPSRIADGADADADQASNRSRRIVR